MQKNNFFLEGRRISDPKLINNGELVSFDMLTKQPFSNSFANLQIRVITSIETWEKFQKGDKSTEWLNISGVLISSKRSRKNSSTYHYKMMGRVIQPFDHCLYEYLGGKCEFDGKAKIKSIRAEQSNQKMLVTKATFECLGECFEAQALRKYARAFEQSGLKPQDFVYVTARLMPSTNKEKMPPYFVVRNLEKV